MIFFDDLDPTLRGRVVFEYTDIRELVVESCQMIVRRFSKNSSHIAEKRSLQLDEALYTDESLNIGRNHDAE